MIQCPKCGQFGTVQKRKTQDSRTHETRLYYYVSHMTNKGHVWHYLSKDASYIPYETKKPETGIQQHFVKS